MANGERLLMHVLPPQTPTHSRPHSPPPPPPPPPPSFPPRHPPDFGPLHRDIWHIQTGHALALAASKSDATTVSRLLDAGMRPPFVLCRPCCASRSLLQVTWRCGW